VLQWTFGASCGYVFGMSSENSNLPPNQKPSSGQLQGPVANESARHDHRKGGSGSSHSALLTLCLTSDCLGRGTQF
jgi:hypothetical protein